MEKYCRFKFQGYISYGLLTGENEIKIINGDIFNEFNLTDKKINNIEDLSLLPPCNPSKIIGAGTNYKRVAGNNGNGLSEPIIFIKPLNTLIGNHKGVVYPAMSKNVTAEVELVAVIGKVSKNLSIDDAKDAIFGYTIAVDITAADFIDGKSICNISKMFDDFTPMGPYIVKSDINPMNLNLRLKKNGITVQDSNTSDMIFNIYDLVSYTSKIMTLLPGDIILTGAPDVAVEINKDDCLEAYIDDLGCLENFVI